MDTPTASPAPVSLDEAFLYWLKLGFISFGGPGKLAGTMVATFFTFLPSFVFILVGQSPPLLLYFAPRAGSS